MNIDELKIGLDIFLSQDEAEFESENYSVPLLKNIKKLLDGDNLCQRNLIPGFNYVFGKFEELNTTKIQIECKCLSWLEAKCYNKSFVRFLSSSSDVSIMDHFTSDDKLNKIFAKESSIFSAIMSLDTDIRTELMEKIFTFIVKAQVDPGRVDKFPNTTKSVLDVIEENLKHTEWYSTLIQRCFPLRDNGFHQFVTCVLSQDQPNKSSKQLFELLSTSHTDYPKSAETLFLQIHSSNNILKTFKTDDDLMRFIHTLKVSSNDTRTTLAKASFRDYVQKDFPKSFELVKTIIDGLPTRNKFLEDCFLCNEMIPPLTNYIQHISKKINLESCQQNDENHILLLTILRKSFDLKHEEGFHDIYESIGISMVQVHEYKKRELGHCIERDKLFEKEIKTEVKVDIDNIIDELPDLEPWTTKYVWKFIRSQLLQNILTLSLVLVYFTDNGVDYMLASDYKDWNKTIQDYKCNENERIKSSSCLIHELDDRLAFGISLGVLVITHFLQFVMLRRCWDVFECVCCYILGCCCGETLKIARSKNPIQYGIVVFLVGLFLPFASHLYLAVIMPLQIFKFKENYAKFLKSKHKQQYKYKEYPKRTLLHDCVYCSGCPNTDCFCRRCGFMSSENDAISMDDYMRRMNKENTNLADLDGTNRLIVSSFENTYILIIQVYMILPLICQRWYATNNDDNASTSSLWTMALTVLSIVSSIFSQSSTATHLHFSRRSKIYTGKNRALRCTYMTSMLLQITGRVTLAVVSGYVLLPSGPFKPVYIILYCMVHIFITFVLKLVPKIRIKHSDTGSSIWKAFMSAGASVYIYLNEDYGKEENATPKDTTEDISMQQNRKSGSRFLFGGLIVLEQGLMYIAILSQYGLDSEIFKDFNLNLFLLVNYFTFTTGVGLEIMFHLTLNPWSELRDYFEKKKLGFILYLFLSTLLPAIVVLIKLSKGGALDSEAIFKGVQTYKLIPILIVAATISGLIIAFKVGSPTCRQNRSKEANHAPSDEETALNILSADEPPRLNYQI